MSQNMEEIIIKKLRLTGLTILLAVLLLLPWDYPVIKMYLFGTTEFESLELDEIKAGLIVDASVDINFGSYAYTKEDEYYVIWTGGAYAENYKYMGIKVPGSERSVMGKIAEAASNGEYVEPVKYVGIIREMSYDEYPLFKAFFQDAGWTDEEIEEDTLPYIIDVSYIEDAKHSKLYLYVLICLLPAVIAIWCSKWN